MLAPLEPDSASVNWWMQVLAMVLSIFVVCLAAVFAFWKQHISMKAARRDRLRLAYSAWLNALDSHQRALPAVRFATPQEPASAEEQDALEEAHRSEAAAFTYVLLLDPDNDRVAGAEKIRSRDSQDKERIRNAEGRDIHECIWRIRVEDEKALHEYARQLCDQLKETV